MVGGGGGFYAIINRHFLRFTRWDAVLQKRLTWALFVLFLSTLMCCQPTDLIWAFLFHKFQFYSPLPSRTHPQAYIEISFLFFLVFFPILFSIFTPPPQRSNWTFSHVLWTDWSSTTFFSEPSSVLSRALWLMLQYVVLDWCWLWLVLICWTWKRRRGWSEGPLSKIFEMYIIIKDYMNYNDIWYVSHSHLV